LAAVAWLALLAVAPPGAAAATDQALPGARTSAPRLVLVNQPASSICVGRTFTVGVWFQQISGGSRAYRIAVSGPRHRRFFYRRGVAPSAHWRFWKITAGRAGKYLTTYFVHPPNSSSWRAYRATTLARRC
jgi:hypothetical protein